MLTPWFHPTLRPSFVGVLECCLHPDLPYTFYRHWDRHRWGRAELDVTEARKNLHEASSVTGLYWRARLGAWQENVEPPLSGVYEVIGPVTQYQFFDGRHWFESRGDPDDACAMLFLAIGKPPRLWRGIAPW